MTVRELGGGLHRIDGRPMDHSVHSVIACVVVRNERSRLHGLLEHHRRLGVDRFFFVDNGSTDGTIDHLLEQADVHLWRSSLNFRDAEYGARWFTEILSVHAPTNWVVIVDADELLWFPDCEVRRVGEVCEELEREGKRAMSGVLLDLYPDGPLADTYLPDDRSPLDVARWFDRRWCHGSSATASPHGNQVGVFGGVRRRLFGGSSWDYCLSKVPILRFGPDTKLVGGQHWTDLPLSEVRSAVLHFKLDARLVDLAWSELDRGQRETHASEYLGYAETLALNPELCAFEEAESVLFNGTSGLMELGIIGHVADPEAMKVRVGALMAQAEVRISTGDLRRGFALLDRAASVDPTAVAPVLRSAALHRRAGERSQADRFFEEASSRRPNDLQILALSGEDVSLRPFWADAVERMLSKLSDRVVVDPFVESRFSCSPSFGFSRPVYEEDWIGFIASVPETDDSIPSFAQRSLPFLWDSPEFRASLDACRSLFTFTERAAGWIRSHSDVPVFVVPFPCEQVSAGFHSDEFSIGSSPTVLQPGFEHHNLNAICDLPVRRNGSAAAFRKLRCVEPRYERAAISIARVQRRDGGHLPDPTAIRATRDVGGVEKYELANLLRSSIVLADLIDSNADTTLLACIARATPILVPRSPGVVEHLGRDYRLLYDSLEEAADLAADRDAVVAAHDQLVEIRRERTLNSFLSEIERSLAEVGLS